MSETMSKNVPVTLTRTARRATRDDFVNRKKVFKNEVWTYEECLLEGEAFFIKKDAWTKFEGPYHLRRDRVNDFAEWMKAGMVWVLE